jgi:hypothetical protein
MSSVSASFAQVATRSKYFLCTGAVNRKTASAGQASVVITTDLSDATGDYSTGNTLFDHGKRVTVVDATSGMAQSIYALVSRVNSEADEEGRNGSTYYVKIFDYAGGTINLARLG